MIRYLLALAACIVVCDIALRAVETGRAWLVGSTYLKRHTNPVGYWIMTGAWTVVALLFVYLVAFLTYAAAAKIGPYKETAFFSIDQPWLTTLITLVLILLAANVVIRRFQDK